LTFTSGLEGAISASSGGPEGGDDNLNVKRNPGKRWVALSPSNYGAQFFP